MVCTSKAEKQKVGSMKLVSWVFFCCLCAVGAFGCNRVSLYSAEAADQSSAATKKPSADSAVPASGQGLRIDSARAMKYVKELVAFGPRPPGTPAQAKQQAFLREKLK